MEEQSFDPIEAEKKELDILLNNGMIFDVPKLRTGIFSKKKFRQWNLKPMMLDTMDRLSYEYIRLDMDEELIKKDALLEAKVLVGKHARRCAKIVAVAVLNMNPWAFLLVWPLAAYFYKRIDSSKLFKLTVIINRLANYGDFINSTRYLSAMRTTKPQLVENQVEED